MPIKPEHLDELLAGYEKPEDLLGEEGLFKQLKKALLERALGAELTHHLGYEKGDPGGRGSDNHRNGSFPKTVLTEDGVVELDVPRDRNGSFEPQIVPKGETRLDGFDDKIISMYARGMTVREIQGHLRELYAVRQGMIIHVRRSKTDQEGHGRKIGIPFGRTRHCPIRALDAWKAASGINQGPVFRPIDRHGKLAEGRLSGDAVSSIVRERVNAAGFEATGYSGHSLRAGLVTSAAQQGISSWKIRQQTGHASDAMMAKYVRDGEMFIGNAAGALL
jgi:hypothetical protein